MTHPRASARATSVAHGRSRSTTAIARVAPGLGVGLQAVVGRDRRGEVAVGGLLEDARAGRSGEQHRPAPGLHPKRRGLVGGEVSRHGGDDAGEHRRELGVVAEGDLDLGSRHERPRVRPPHDALVGVPVLHEQGAAGVLVDLLRHVDLDDVLGQPGLDRLAADAHLDGGSVGALRRAGHQPFSFGGSMSTDPTSSARGLRRPLASASGRHQAGSPYTSLAMTSRRSPSETSQVW